MAIYPLLRPLLFALDAERAHRLAITGLSLAALIPGGALLEKVLFGYRHPALNMELWGLRFANPVGLAAGFDKNGEIVEPLLGLGFGFVEVGTATPRPQPGNPRPRLFRLPQDGALINRMGFNNRGALHMAALLGAPGSHGGVVGVNIGKNLDTPLAEAVGDYLTCMHALYPVADYLVINVSSPNTPGLRDLQSKSALTGIARVIREERDKLCAATGRWAPFLIKIAPDLSESQLAEVAEVALEAAVDGVIAANTSTGREGLVSPRRTESGGLSGVPLHGEGLRTIRVLHRLAGKRLPLIGVGGIFSAEDAYAFIRAGASLVQIYTGLIYQGPRLVHRIKRGLVGLLERDGFSNVAEAVGSGTNGG